MTTNVTINNTTWTSVASGTTTSVLIDVFGGDAFWCSSVTQPANQFKGHPYSATANLFNKALALNVSVWMKSSVETPQAVAVVTTSLEIFGS